MSQMLASVNSLDESRLILHTAVDIIDLKQPELGALGALPTTLVKQIVQQVNHQKPISATIGDLPMQAELVFNAVAAMSETGVDYIKIGFFPNGNWQQTILKLKSLTAQGHKLIAVIFADAQPDFNIISLLQQNGFTGIMLDTMNKSSASLPLLMSYHQMQEFVVNANKAKLFCGLAGSLKATDIPLLLKLNADYLGFRGALCEQHNRTASLSTKAINQVLTHFK